MSEPHVYLRFPYDDAAPNVQKVSDPTVLEHGFDDVPEDEAVIYSMTDGQPVLVARNYDQTVEHLQNVVHQLNDTTPLAIASRARRTTVVVVAKGSHSISVDTTNFKKGDLINVVVFPASGVMVDLTDTLGNPILKYGPEHSVRRFVGRGKVELTVLSNGGQMAVTALRGTLADPLTNIPKLERRISKYMVLGSNVNDVSAAYADAPEDSLVILSEGFPIGADVILYTVGLGAIGLCIDTVADPFTTGYVTAGEFHELYRSTQVEIDGGADRFRVLTPPITTTFVANRLYRVRRVDTDVWTKSRLLPWDDFLSLYNTNVGADGVHANLRLKNGFYTHS